MAVFNFNVDAQPSAQVGFNTINATFGDGYSMSASNGINNRAESWSISVTGIMEENCIVLENVFAVMQFIDDHKGADSFEWENPLGQTNKYVCNGYSPIKRSQELVGITATFTQVFR
jgi:phage-related protein